MGQNKTELPPDQQRVVDRLSAASDDAYAEAILHLLYDIDEGELPVLNFFIDEIKSDNHEGDDAVAINRIHELLKELGIDPIKWSESFMEGSAESVFSGHTVSRREAIHDTRAGNGIGTFITALAYDVLPIEHNEDSWGNVSILLARGNEHTVRVHTEGSLYMEDHSLVEADDDQVNETNINYTIRILADVCLRAS